MVLVDTSIWVDHLRRGNPRLEALLMEALVACHPYVVGELACGTLQNRVGILSLLGSLPQAPVISQEELLHFIDLHALAGLGIGFVDIHLLASARLSDMPLWTADKRLARAAEDLGLAFS
ncbi:MAG TPA: type II toxin-antitoxin system VapC family toxin [Desulfobacteraceae bacterium]|nr:type II toxin-antitoxin system VapC family toxin [Desulfobacteraceae bacterium]